MHSIKPKVAVIIPAHNEATRIADVLFAVTRSPYAHEVIVVSDGSTDQTCDVVRMFPAVRLVELRANVGKGGAMCAGVSSTDAEIIAFVDADLAGLRPDHVDRIIRPIVENRCDMCIGVFRGGKFWSDTGQRVFPSISGQRAMRRYLFESCPHLDEIRMGVEITIHTYAKRQRARVLRVVLQGVSNTFKEQKMGFVKGTKARTKMYAEIARAVVRNRKRDRIAGRLVR